MNALANFHEDDLLKKILLPMFQILNKKNILNIDIVKKENNIIYICFDRNYLSECNQLILEKISYIYSDIVFYSDDKIHSYYDKIKYLYPSEDYDKGTQIIKMCRNKKVIVLKLDTNDLFTSIGTSILLANT